MKQLHYILLLSCLVLAGMFFSCQQYETDAGKSDSPDEITSYDGTVYGYLADRQAHPGVTYDSLLYLVDNIQGLKDSLNRTTVYTTLFAVPDKCFSNALNVLNLLRGTYKLGRNLTLSDFLIEPFVVNDSTFTQLDTEGTMDTTVVQRHYDYRGLIDSLVCRYIYTGVYNSAAIADAGGSLEPKDLKFNESLRMEYGRYPASGAVGMGTRHMSLFETGGSKQTNSWVEAQVSQFDIHASNGWIHLLLPGHEFGFSQMVELFQNYGNEKKKK